MESRNNYNQKPRHTPRNNPEWGYDRDEEMKQSYQNQGYGNRGGDRGNNYHDRGGNNKHGGRNNYQQPRDFQKKPQNTEMQLHR